MHFAEGMMFIKNAELANRSQQKMMHVNACRALLEEQRCLTCIELTTEAGVAKLFLVRFFTYLRRC